MDEIKNEKPRWYERQAQMLLSGAVAVILLLLALLLIKFCFQDLYRETENWIRQNFYAETALSEVLSLPESSSYED